MAHEVMWTKQIVEEFSEEAMLSDFENQILRTRVKGMSRLEQSMMMHCSLSKIDRTIKELKKKYDAVQTYDVILPPRQKFHDMLPEYK